MKFKLDENLGRSVQQIFQETGHDCHTVRDEGLLGDSDPDVLQAAQSEKRILVTMDHDFGNVFAYPPEQTIGIAIINVPGQPNLGKLRMLIKVLLDGLTRYSIVGQLWIVEPGRIREHESKSESKD